MKGVAEPTLWLVVGAIILFIVLLILLAVVGEVGDRGGTFLDVLRKVVGL